MDKEKLNPVSENDSLISANKELILYNDDVNTFDHVIVSLIEVCGHNQNQAEQCALIAHLNGKCSVKSGSYDELKPMAEEMGRRELTVEII
jgi:ATP-dependent Clp protease adaptor protein ClpS